MSGPFPSFRPLLVITTFNATALPKPLQSAVVQIFHDPLLLATNFCLSTMTQITISPLSSTSTIDDKADPNPDDYVLLGASTATHFNAHRGLKRLHFENRVHYMDAYLICASLADGILYTNVQETKERLSLEQKVSDSYNDTFTSPPTPQKGRTRLILKALLLSFRKIVLGSPGERREGCIIEWSQAPSATSFPLTCTFRDTETLQTSRVTLEANAIALVDMSQRVPEIHHSTYESPSNTPIRGGDAPTELPPMPLELPLRCIGSFESSADLALLAWAVHHPSANTVQFANCVSFGDAIGIYPKVPQGLLDGWTDEDRGSEEEEAGLFRFYTPKQVTGDGPISMSTANYVFGMRPLFFVSYTFRKSHRCRPTQNEAILENFEVSYWCLSASPLLTRTAASRHRAAPKSVPLW